MDRGDASRRAARVGGHRRAAARAGRAPEALPKLLPVLAFVALGVVLARTAWVCDDAYISFRSADNLVHGYGLRWNVAERVQVFTNPLWTLIFAGVYALSQDAFAVAIGLSLVVSLAAVGLVGWRWAASPGAGLAAIALLVSSRAFVDYSSSGLENPLIHLLLVGFFLAGRITQPSRRLMAQALIAGCAAFNRIDSLVILVPALAWSWWSTPNRLNGLLRLVAGFTPFLLWEAFATLYFGSPLPNTSFAKLSTGIPAGELATQGMRYLSNSFATDPLTLISIAASLAAALAVRTPARLAAAAGLVLHVAYSVVVGGDFMSGRLLSSSVLLAVMVLVSTPLPRPAFLWPAVAAAGIALGFAAPHPNLTSGRGFGGMRAGIVDAHGISDERRYYFGWGGWLNGTRGVAKPCSPPRAEAWLARGTGRKLAVERGIGMFGFFAGPGLYVIDAHALANPFLARLPIVRRDPFYAQFCADLTPARAAVDWRIGHFLRALPPGYLATVACGGNRIGDAKLAALYDRIALVTRGPLADPRRLGAIVGLALDPDRPLARREAPREWRNPDWGEVLACRPDDADAWIERAAMGTAQSAAEDLAGLRRALARRPDDAALLMALGKKLVQVNDRRAAANAFARVTERVPAYGPAWYHLGVTLALLGDREGALAAFRAGVRIDPTNDEGVRYFGVLLLMAGQLDEAEAAFRRAVALNDCLAEPWFHLATILQRRGQSEEATAMLRRALICEPENPTVLTTLAEALATAGRRAEAADLLARARRAAANDTASQVSR